jgi:hypothetical protein
MNQAINPIKLQILKELKEINQIEQKIKLTQIKCNWLSSDKIKKFKEKYQWFWMDDVNTLGKSLRKSEFSERGENNNK